MAVPQARAVVAVVPWLAWSKRADMGRVPLNLAPGLAS